MKVPTVKLRDGREIPQIGLGLWLVKDRAEFDVSFDSGVKIGYRHFDDAQAYKNEQFLGEDIAKSDLKREDVFITTKIAVENFGYEKAEKSVDGSLEKLQTDYIDLLLLHFPLKNLREETWRAAEDAKKSGKVRSIGVSNYTIRHLEEMKKYVREMPVVNQVELHVFLQQPELLDYCAKNDIAVEAYSPLAHAAGIGSDPVIREIAAKHGKTYAQIMLRWCVEKNLIILPKSVKPERVAENFAVFDFSLDGDDIAKLANLDKDFRTCWDPETDPRAE